MPQNQIAGRIAHFISAFPPFNMLSTEQQSLLAMQAKVRYAPVGTVLFRQNEPAGSHFYLVAQGSVRLVAEQHGKELLIDLCDEGDVFGVRPMLVRDPYIATAEVVEESIIYAFPWTVFEPWMRDVPGLALFFAAGFASGLPVVREQLEHGMQLKTVLPSTASGYDDTRLTTRVQHRQVLSCSPETSVMLAATMMRDARLDYIVIVDPKHRPLGIVTDTDLRNEIATGHFPIETPVERIMGQPVYCVREGMNLGELQLDMLQRNLHHLVVTSDGSNQTALLGIITDHDLLAAEGSSAAALQQAIALSRKTEQLLPVRGQLNQLVRDLIQRGVNASWLGSLVGRLQDMITQRLMELVAEQMRQEQQALPNLPFCWLMLGSGGRKEQLLPSDQDHALLFADPPAQQLETVRARFISFAKRVGEGLQAMGFANCPAQMMASNPQWCLSQSEWQAKFSRWMTEPDPRAVMLTTIFYDFRPIFGEVGLAAQLQQHIREALPKHQWFISALAKNACENPPPLSFFRQFIVEKDGAHQQYFDIKTRAMMPLADAARVLWLQHGLPTAHSTTERFERLSELEPEQAALYREAARAYEVLMRYRTTATVSGQPLDPQALSKIDRQLLRSSFQPIRELQELLQVRFQTSWLR
jgi:CBS domain-containing protein